MFTPEQAAFVNQLIRQRRSVFPAQFTGEVIPDALIEQLLENANWAPTHGKTEPWRFVVFTGNGLQQLAEFQAAMYQKHTPAADFKQEKYDKLLSSPLKCSHIIALGMKRQETGKIPEIEEVEAVACAVQNLYLSATAHNLGGYWGTGGVTYMPEAKAFFGLGVADLLLGFFYLGVPVLPLPQGVRKPIADKVTWVR